MNLLKQMTAVLLFNCLVGFSSNANNLQITAINHVGSNVSFNISWDNSWDNGILHDAAWVFIKYRLTDCNNFVPFTHALLNTNMGTHTIPVPLKADPIDASPDNTGIILRRSSTGTGSIASTTVTLNIPALGAGLYEIRVFGIEMTYINQGAFYLGDGISANTFGQGNAPSVPYLVSSNVQINAGTSAGQLAGAGLAGNIPAAYPKGYNSFYAMKTEISQRQYVDFLNTLSFQQANNRFSPGPDLTYSLGGTWPAYNDGGIPDRACGDISYEDISAYFDWAAMRPMTELEFEKVCRGPNPVVAGEYAWGNTSLVLTASRVSAGTPSETVSNVGTVGVCNYGDGTNQGTYRVGFLGTGTSTRTTIGAGYYGNTELSGNLWEHIINVSAGALTYTGIRGDGYLDVAGYQNVANWPISSTSSDTGTGYRGASWYVGSSNLTVSDRGYITVYDNRYTNVGGRGCR